MLPDGRKFVAQVDGGSGHSGRRSPDIHMGLGKLDPDTRLNVQLPGGTPPGSSSKPGMKLAPGWHTVLLGKSAPAQLAANHGGIAR